MDVLQAHTELLMQICLIFASFKYKIAMVVFLYYLHGTDFSILALIT